MPTAIAILKSLPTNSQFQAMTNAKKKHAAEQGLSTIFVAIKAGKIELGSWEKKAIESALVMINHGFYVAAMNDVVDVMWPIVNRSPEIYISAATEARTIDEFESELFRLIHDVPAKADY
jgi:hypothetical protein